MGSRIKRERKTIVLMIYDYCRGHHQNKELCSECTELKDYALERLNACPFQEGKTTCAKCPVHCYEQEMRDKIKTVMKYAGPRMTYRNPILALRHLFDGRRETPIKA